MMVSCHDYMSGVVTGDPVRLCLKRACHHNYGEVCCSEYYGYSGAYDSTHVATGGQARMSAETCLQS
eukprot:COSAG02_NODE_1606_length_11716_cov_7.032022_1_plen_67_part_00